MRIHTLAGAAIVLATGSMLVLTVQILNMDRAPARRAAQARPDANHLTTPDGVQHQGAAAAALSPDTDPFVERFPVLDTTRAASIPVITEASTPQDIADAVIAENAGLLQGVAKPDTVTLVSGVWDVGRGDMAVPSQWAVLRRPLTHYINGLKQFLAYKFPKVLFVDPALYDHDVKPLIEEAKALGAGPTKVILRSLHQLREDFGLGSEVDKVRRSSKWLQLGDTVANSPTAVLPDFAPLVLSKLRLTREAARWNPHNTDAFLWLDASNVCHDPFVIGLNKQPNMVKYLDKLLLTFSPYKPEVTNIKGFERAAFNEYMGRGAKDASAVALARGAILGGTRAHLEIATAVFNELVQVTLQRGLLGSDEPLLTILDHVAPNVIHRFDNTGKGNCGVFNEFVLPPVNVDVDGYDLRGLHCRWIPEENTAACFQGGRRCPAIVTPQYLEEAKGQGVCADERDKYYCSVVCAADGQVTWQSAMCSNDLVTPCPPWGRTVVPGYHPEVPQPPTVLHGPELHPQPSAAAAAMSGQQLVNAQALRGDPFSGTSLLAKAKPADAEIVQKTGGFNLRGAQCEIKNGVERCFSEDPEGREECPPHVDSVLLTTGADQGLCHQEVTSHYCTVTCSDGEKINWHAHEIKWCEDNKDRCPERPPIVPAPEFRLKPWSLVVRPPMQCTRPAGGMPKVTVLILAFKETESLSASLDTYDKAGFLQAADEKIIYLNARNAEMEAVVAKYTLPPYNLKVMGDEKNYQIAQAMTWLIGNATNEYVLFLEKDFRLVESLDCVMEQLDTGIRMLKAGTAHVIKYRARHNPGRPNWARILYMGHEDDVFKNQPNLLCNFYHWIESPEQRWPQQFWPCSDSLAVDSDSDRSKVFYCSKAFYCNWSNNPYIISKSWWFDEYASKFDKWKNINPYEDLELYMNWEPNAWNDRPYVVAQGEGLFRHVDKKKWG